MLTGGGLTLTNGKLRGTPNLTFEFHYNLGNGSYEFETQNYA